MAKKLFDELTTVKNHSISDFLFDEEASIPEGRLFAIGSLIIVLTCTLGVHEAIAWHTSHSSHSSHSSHRSGSGGHVSHESHSSHVSGESHGNHSNHSSHSSSSHSNAVPHSNVAPHSNAAPHSSHSNTAPALSELNAIRTPADETALNLSGKLGLAAANQIPPDTTAVVTETRTGGTQ